MRNAAGTAIAILRSRLLGRTTLASANLYVTQRCNLRCVYCSSPLRRTPELTTAEWTRILDELAELGCRRVTFLGGEPLLRSDLAELIDHASGRGMATVVTSNGVLVPRRIDAVRKVDTLVLSLDAPGPANDVVRGDGVFAAVAAAISVAREHRIAVKLNAVLSAATAHSLDDLLEFCEREDLFVTINIMRSGAADLWNDAAAFKDEDGAIAALCLRLATLARTNRRLLFSPDAYRYAATWREFGRDRLEAGDAAPDDPRIAGAPQCHAGRSYISIDADGSVYACATTFQRIRGGNARSDGVESAWRALRSHPCIACFSPCMVEQNLLHSLDPGVIAHFARRHLLRFA